MDNGHNLKTTKLLDCELIGACAVIRENTVLWDLFRIIIQEYMNKKKGSFVCMSIS